MASFDLSFTPRYSAANASSIRTRAEELDMLQARLLGQAGDLDGDFNHAASQFTDMIAWNIGEQSSEELQLWRDAGVAIAYASSMIELWAKHVEEFQEERSEQTTEWFNFRTAKAAEIPGEYQGKTITATYPAQEGMGLLGDANKCRDIYDEVVVKLADLEEREQANYRKFENHAEEVANMLREGPTKANVQALIDAGINSWAFYNMDPNHYTMLVDGRDLTEENAQEWSRELEGYWSGAQPIDERYHELMLMMSMITTNAMQAQQGGTSYRSEEMDFLEAFYAELEHDEARNSMGVLGIPSRMEGDHLSDEEREHALGVLGDGLLTLSDERIGGGYDALPASVRDVIEGPDFSTTRSGAGYTNTHADWMARTGHLSDLLEHSHDDMEGGVEFSARMMEAVSGGIVRMDALGHSNDESLVGLVDVATRNEDVNYAILTGELPEGVEVDLPWSGEAVDNTRERIISSLYSHEWSDDGDAVRGLTEWMEESSWSDDEDERRMAAEAMDGLLEVITTKEMHDALSDTGVEVELSDGTEIPNAPFTAVNGEIADGLAHLFEVYIESFADEQGIERGHVDFNWERESDDLWNDDSRILAMSPAERLIFLEYVMGHEDSAVRAHTASTVYTVAQTEMYLENGNSTETGANAGVLQSLIDSALHNEAVNRGLDHAQELEMRRKLVEGMVNTGNNALGLVPGMGVALQSVSQFVTPEMINQAFDNFISSTAHVDSRTTAIDVDYYTSARVLSEIIERGGGELPKIDEEISIEGAGGATPQEVLERAGLLAAREGVHFIDFEGEPGEDAPSSSEIQEAMNRFLASSEVDWTHGENYSGTDFSSNFTGYYGDYYDPIQDQMRYAEDNIDHLYERVPADAPTS
jgi:hypothetical protein